MASSVSMRRSRLAMVRLLGKIFNGFGGALLLANGLTWALLSAGCPNVVVSQWGVDDESTATLMTSFYNSLLKGQRKSLALRGAALSLSREKKTMHPYYWSPFVLVGDGN